MLITGLADERLTTVHRAKLAYVYVRQSSVGQVRHHQESTELQYRLVDRAVGVVILPWFGGRGQAAMRSIAAGERYPSAEWRRWVLYQPSIHPNRSRRASARVA